MLTKLAWTCVSILLPGWGTMLFLELYAPVAPAPQETRSGEGVTPAQPEDLPPEFLPAVLAVLGLLYGGLWLVLSTVRLTTGDPDAALHMCAAATLLAAGFHFMKRGARLLKRSSERSAK